MYNVPRNKTDRLQGLQSQCDNNSCPNSIATYFHKHNNQPPQWGERSTLECTFWGTNPGSCLTYLCSVDYNVHEMNFVIILSIYAFQ